MVPGFYPWDPTADLSTLDPWDKVNMNLSATCQSGGMPAPRTKGSIKAMHAAYNSGQVFEGRLNIPVLDIRYYLEPILDMHHSQASFAARARMIKAHGHADNQVIWMVGCNLDPVYLGENCSYEPTGDALDILDDWLSHTGGKSLKQIVKNKPEAATDACFDNDGRLIYAGADAWDGVLNKHRAGACTSAFPILSTSRIQAGGSQRDDIFKCTLKPVSIALKDGTYAGVNFSDKQKLRLKQIFPTGVCDYRKGDMGKPKAHIKSHELRD